MLKKLNLFIAGVVMLFLFACGDSPKKPPSPKIEGRWYTSVQLLQGKQTFQDNCVACHGDKAQGLAEDWKRPLVDGTYPAPPLNGDAHAWHHSKEALMRTLNMGGIPLGGTMPSFKDKLSVAEKEAVLAYVMSLWPDQTYQAWSKRNAPAK